jgi:hypothetical protein
MCPFPSQEDRIESFDNKMASVVTQIKILIAAVIIIIITVLILGGR